MSKLATLQRIATSLPGVTIGTSYCTLAFRIRGRLLARLREDGETLVVKLGFEERDFLIRANPRIYFLTEHYLNYPMVLVRLPAISAGELRDLLAQAWRLQASKRMVKELDARG
jgi:hypothetical protein